MEENKKNKVLTPEEQQRKDKLNFRLFILLIVLDALLVGYLIFEMIKIFSK